jgi:hypothetical protein
MMNLRDLNALLREADREQAAFELAHPEVPAPAPTKEYKLTEKDINELVMKKFDAIASALGAECGLIEKRLREEIAQLRAEIGSIEKAFQNDLGQVRAAITVSSANDGIINFDRWRNDNAA